nr:DUF6677 family protein [Natrinema salifodinae]
MKLWPAYCLAVLCPGAGHLYVRQWTRGLSWGLLYGIALVFLSSGALLLDGSVVEPFVLSALRLEEIAFGDVAFPLAILVLNAVDLYTLVVLDRAG